MSKISVLGSEIAFEFEGVFENATLRKNITLVKHTILSQSAKTSIGGSEIGWSFRSAGGPRGIYVAYASEHEIPCELIVNGEILQSHALFEPTGGSTHRSIDWRYQASTILFEGSNVVSLRSERALPSISALGIGPPPKSETAPVDIYAERIRLERAAAAQGGPISIKSRSLLGLVREIQKIAHDDRAATSFRAVLPHFIDAVVEDAANGQTRIGFGGPLNGQRFRQQIFNRLLRLGIDTIVETGAYLGTSTAFFARQGLPVHACEFNKAYFVSATVQTASCPNVSLYLQDSRSFLRLLAEQERTIKFPLFYLDAHWNEDLPLADEIAIITHTWQRYAIMVDDFEVPGTDYGFDRYPNGLELTLSYLAKHDVDLSRMAILFPSATPSAETGKRRGTLVLVPNDLYDEHLIGERLLYRHDPEVSASCDRE